MNFDLVSAAIGIVITLMGVLVGRAAREVPTSGRHRYRGRRRGWNPGSYERRQRAIQDDIALGVREWRELMREFNSPKSPGFDPREVYVPSRLCMCGHAERFHGESRCGETLYGFACKCAGFEPVPANEPDPSPTASPEAKK